METSDSVTISISPIPTIIPVSITENLQIMQPSTRESIIESGNLSEDSDSDFEFPDEIIIPDVTRNRPSQIVSSPQENDFSINSPSSPSSSISSSSYSKDTPRTPTKEWNISVSNESNESESPHTIKTVQGEKQRYWKLNFLFVLLPLIFCGFPIHLLLGGSRGMTSPKTWFQQIFIKDPIPIRLLTLIFLIIGLGINGYFISASGTLLYSLVIKGEVRSNVFADVINVLRLAPMIIPLNLVWIWGYTVRKLLLSFDRVTYPEVEIHWLLNSSDPKEGNQTRSNNAPKSRWKNDWRKLPPYRVYLSGIYLLILFNQAINLMITLENIKRAVVNDVSNYSGGSIDGWIDFALIFMYNLMLPIYICLTWGIQFEFDRLSLYIKSLIACRVHPDPDYFGRFKKYYKLVANHVMAMNDICSIYYSWVLLVLYSSLYDEIYGVIFVLFEAIISSAIRESGGVGAAELKPMEVRMFVGNFFGGLAQLVVLGLMVWFCITANDTARHLHVRLNDFVSEPYVVLTPELYKKYRMLKHYIHSRMETEKPALLSISIVGALPYCRCIYDWKVGYRVRH